MKKILITNTLLLILFIFNLSAKDINIISMNQDKIILEYNATEYKLEKKEAGNNFYYKIKPSFKAVVEAKEGVPELPYFSKTVGLPVDGSFSYKILEIRSEIKRGIDVLPTPKMVVIRITSIINFIKMKKSTIKMLSIPIKLLPFLVQCM